MRKMLTTLSKRGRTVIPAAIRKRHRIQEGDSASGEPSLRILAAESGGRYFEGGDGDTLICQVPVPPELAKSEWRIFKIARNSETGTVFIDKDTAVPSLPSIQTRMKWRGEEFRHDIVLAHTRTGTILVWQ